MMMDHYKVLGISRNAGKEEIKEAFRKLALKFHPDRHSQSAKAVKDGATLQFKNISEAYEVLIDDRKRADYNMRFSRRGGPTAYSSSSSYRDSYYGNSNKPRRPYSSSSRKGFNFDVALRFVTTRAFLLNLAFTCVVLGGAVFVERSADALWKTQNSGKSFEEAMESIDKLKTQKEKRESKTFINMDVYLLPLCICYYMYYRCLYPCSYILPCTTDVCGKSVCVCSVSWKRERDGQQDERIIGSHRIQKNRRHYLCLKVKVSHG